MSSDPKTYFVFLADEISEPGLSVEIRNVNIQYWFGLRRICVKR